MKKTILFGAGRLAEWLLLNLPELEITHVIDNDTQKQGEKVSLGGKLYLVSSPTILKEISLSNTEIIIGSASVKEMLEQIRALAEGKAEYLLVKQIVFDSAHGNRRFQVLCITDDCRMSFDFIAGINAVILELGCGPISISVNYLSAHGFLQSNADKTEGNIMSFSCANPCVYVERTSGLKSLSVDFNFLEPDYETAYEFTSRFIKKLSNVSNDVTVEFVPDEDVEPVIFGDGDVKPIAYYLPQFHRTAENDAWWERGFTEWTNVTKAYPMFEGHYQPHLPIDMGFYDLFNDEVQKRQIELAKKYGVYGFCYYYYHYKNTKLLDMPISRHLDNKELDFPFCIWWANENWTKVWTGDDKEILVEVGASEDYYVEVIRDMLPFLRDPRYIRVDGKPLIIVYKIKPIPDPRSFTRIWREECRRAGVGDILLLFPWDGTHNRPIELGFDGLTEFYPYCSWHHNSSHKYKLYSNDFSGFVMEYDDFINICDNYETDGLSYKCVFTTWDNTARYRERALISTGSTPAKYKQWLCDTIAKTQRLHSSNDRYVFINAWNEWAEGAHLEPDRRYGYAYLKATREAIIESHGKGD